MYIGTHTHTHRHTRTTMTITNLISSHQPGLSPILIDQLSGFKLSTKCRPSETSLKLYPQTRRPTVICPSIYCAENNPMYIGFQAGSHNSEERRPAPVTGVRSYMLLNGCVRVCVRACACVCVGKPSRGTLTIWQNCFTAPLHLIYIVSGTVHSSIFVLRKHLSPRSGGWKRHGSQQQKLPWAPATVPRLLYVLMMQRK